MPCGDLQSNTHQQPDSHHLQVLQTEVQQGDQHSMADDKLFFSYSTAHIRCESQLTMNKDCVIYVNSRVKVLPRSVDRACVQFVLSGNALH